MCGGSPPSMKKKFPLFPFFVRQDLAGAPEVRSPGTRFFVPVEAGRKLLSFCPNFSCKCFSTLISICFLLKAATFHSLALGLNALFAFCVTRLKPSQ